jgi:energy-coupling factor transporter ATP-binding protein EcfA2
MLLKSFKYSEYEKESREWILNEFSLKEVNLIVGMNAAGKSRTLRVINGLSRILTEKRIPFPDGSYWAKFIKSNDEIIYEIKIKNNSITKESLEISGKQYLTRGMHGSGKIRNVNVSENLLEFKIPPHEAAITRRDSIQYPYLEQLYNWGNNLRCFWLTQI